MTRKSRRGIHDVRFLLQGSREETNAARKEIPQEGAVTWQQNGPSVRYKKGTQG